VLKLKKGGQDRMDDKIKFLIIDDKKIMGDIFHATLSYIGHEIMVVQNGNDGIRLIKYKEFDVVFLDIMMPERDGVSVLEEIRGIEPELPVIMMTGFALEEQRQRTRELGAKGCLNKPFEMDDVRMAVKLALGREL